MPGPSTGFRVVLPSRSPAMVVCTTSIASEDEAPRLRANASSLGSGSFYLTRATASRCAWRGRSSGGSLTLTVGSIGAKDTPLNARAAPQCTRDPSLSQRGGSLRAFGRSLSLTHPSFRPSRESLRANRAPARTRDAALRGSGDSFEHTGPPKKIGRAHV